MPAPEQVFRFEGKCVRNTPKAVQVDFDDLDELVWLPLSQILNPEELFNSDGSLIPGTRTIQLPKWLATRTGLL